MKDGIHQNEDGFHEMPLPFRNGKPRLPDSKEMAKVRLQYLRRRFQANHEYYEHYVAFMEDILKRGHAEKVPLEETEKDSVWYIPHHVVPSKETRENSYCV